MELNYKSLGQRVRMYRKQQKLSQELLAEKSGLTTAHFSHIETANTKVSLPSLINIANALDVSLDDLLVDSIERNTHVTIHEFNQLLADCSPVESRALLKILKAGKEAIRDI